MSQVVASRRHRLAVAMALGLVAAACPRASLAEPDHPPVELLASLALGPPTTLKTVQRYADAIRPGLGAALDEATLRTLLAGAVELPSLDGFDSAAWPYVLVAGVPGASPIALLGPVTDGQRLAASAGRGRFVQRGRWAIVGAPEVLAAIADYALTAIARRPRPVTATATVWLPRLLAHFRPQIELIRNVMITMAEQDSGDRDAPFKAMVKSLGEVAAQTDVIVVALDAAPGLCSLEFLLTLRPGSWLAQFVGLQRPADFAIFEKLPAGSAALRFGGHLEFGPFATALPALLPAELGPQPGRSGPPVIEKLRGAMTGDFVMTAQALPGAGVSFSYLAGLIDTRAGEAAISTLFTAIGAGVQYDTFIGRISAAPSAAHATHDGVVLHGIDVRRAPSPARVPGESPDGQLLYAAFDSIGLQLMTRDSVADAATAIDAARRKAARFVVPVSVAAARQRKDSAVLLIDPDEMLAAVNGGPRQGGGPLAVSAGRAGRNLRITLALPATALRAVAAMSR